ncbi:hypothetical protein Ddc_21252 [Ditylenchus destructor]|nr:hypothetical protein Ddc_21252 [Ditylenchus destructor]
MLSLRLPNAHQVTELNEEIFHKCVFYPIHTDEVKVPFCLFFYDEAMNKPVTISMMGDNFVFFADIRFTNSLFHENFTDDFCVNVGGCEKKTDEYVSCLSAEKIYLMCYCKRKGREPFYNDYDAYLDVHNLPTFVPYCNKKNASANVPSLQSSSDQFFCYESYTFTSNGDMPNYPTDINTDFGFYNESHGNSSIQNVMDCSSKELTKRCRVGKNNRYTCCCRAHFGLKSPKVGNFSFPTANEDRLYQINARACNNRAMLKRFVDSLTVRKAEDFISNYRFVMKDLEECNFEVSPHKASPYDTALTAERDLLCYFSVKLNNQSGDPSSINAEHYDPVKAHQRRFGIFSVLCNVTNWTAQENAHGCSCRLIEPATPKHRKKMPAEISCCCVAKHAKNYKDTLVDTLFEKIFNVESGNSRKNDKAI